MPRIATIVFITKLPKTVNRASSVPRSSPSSTTTQAIHVMTCPLVMLLPGSMPLRMQAMTRMKFSLCVCMVKLEFTRAESSVFATSDGKPST